MEQRSYSVVFRKITHAMEVGDESEVARHCTPAGLEALQRMRRKYSAPELTSYLGSKLNGHRTSRNSVEIGVWMDEIYYDSGRKLGHRPYYFVMERSWFTWRLADVRRSFLVG